MSPSWIKTNCPQCGIVIHYNKNFRGYKGINELALIKIYEQRICSECNDRNWK